MKNDLRIMKSPRNVDVEITSACNLQCPYCYYFDNRAVAYRDLPLDRWQAFFKELGRSAVMGVTLQGGEPFIRGDLAQVIASIVENRMRFAILTNGTRITPDIAGFIAKTNRCDTVQVSIDGADAAVHDACRQDGSFDKAVRGIRILQQNNVPVSVRVTIQRKNVHDLDNIADFLLNRLALPGFSTNAAGYLGSCRRHWQDIALDVGQRQQAMAALDRLEKRYPGRITATAGPLAELHLWRRMVAARRDRAPGFANGGHLTGCGCAHEKIAVRSDGTVIPCVMLPTHELGRINRDRLERVWRDHPVLNDLRSRPAIPLTDFAQCRDCGFAPYCTGNCPGLAQALTGQLSRPSPDACLRRFLDSGGRLPTAA